MEQIGTSSRKVWILVVTLVVLALVVVGLVYLVVGLSPKKESSVSTKSSENTVATKEKVDQDMKELEASLKQAAKDQASAKAVLKDGDNQVKVGK